MNMSYTSMLLVAMSSCLLSLVLTPIARRIAIRLGMLDHPRDNVKVHPSPVPYLGGAAIFAAFLPPTAVVLAYTGHDAARILALLGCSAAIFVLGLRDDMRGLSVGTRLAVQAGVAVVLVTAGFRVQLDFLPGWLAIAVSMLWIVGITNAFNFIDIMDGLAGGVAVITAIALTAITAPGCPPIVAAPALALAGAVLGFLRYNFQPARIFMGNAGSYLLGMVLSALALQVSYTQVNRVAFFSPVIILWLPLCDIALVTFFRAAKRLSVFRASNDHLVLRLVAMGLSRRRTVLLAYLTCIMLAAAAFAVTSVPVPSAILIYVSVILVTAVCGRILGRVRM